MANFPDLHGFEMASHIESTSDRLIILWFSRISRELRRWDQVQVTLINAVMKGANLEISDCMPKMKSSELSEDISGKRRKVQFKIMFDPGFLYFECDDVVCSEFSRNIVFSPE